MIKNFQSGRQKVIFMAANFEKKSDLKIITYSSGNAELISRIYGNRKVIKRFVHFTDSALVFFAKYKNIVK